MQVHSDNYTTSLADAVKQVRAAALQRYPNVALGDGLGTAIILPEGDFVVPDTTRATHAQVDTLARAANGPPLPLSVFIDTEVSVAERAAWDDRNSPHTDRRAERAIRLAVDKKGMVTEQGRVVLSAPPVSKLGAELRRAVQGRPELPWSSATQAYVGQLSKDDTGGLISAAGRVAGVYYVPARTAGNNLCRCDPLPEDHTPVVAVTPVERDGVFVWALVDAHVGDYTNTEYLMCSETCYALSVRNSVSTTTGIRYHESMRPHLVPVYTLHRSEPHLVPRPVVDSSYVAYHWRDTSIRAALNYMSMHRMEPTKFVKLVDGSYAQTGVAYKVWGHTDPDAKAVRLQKQFPVDGLGRMWADEASRDAAQARLDKAARRRAY